MAHAQNILALLDAQRCTVCGQKAVRGSTVCLDCAGREPVPHLVEECNDVGLAN